MPEPSLLVITPRVPTPDRDGGSLRLVRSLAILRALGYTVSVLACLPESFPPFTASLEADRAALAADGVELLAPPVEEALRRGPDAVLLHGVWVASRFSEAARRHAPGARILFDTIDLHHVREFRAARLSGNLPQLRNALSLKRRELEAARRADCTLVVSERERGLLRAALPGCPCVVVPNIHPAGPPGPDFARRAGLLFLGAYTFAPNVDAMRWFVRAQLPALRQRLPGVSLTIAGADPTPEVEALAGPGVTVTGFVPKLAPLFDAHRLSVVPLRYGAGIKGKLLASLAHGLPAVSSAIGAEGLPASPAVAVAADDGWAEAVAALYEDEARWRAAAEAGRALVAAEYSVPTVRARLIEALEVA